MNTPIHDLRPLAPPQRHRLAFQCFDALAPGESFELVNDHEPRGLLMQFRAHHPEAFSWQVVQAEPDYWRIRVGRLVDGADQATPAPGGCGCSCGGRG
ncbi:DUF2249 domain-containing protein [Roseateles sp.]|uniref:DUF2249 domain-containing protein n=1 Tax=Roseateles sp. TaxID=1971397 RepID=UPI0039EA770E